VKGEWDFEEKKGFRKHSVQVFRLPLKEGTKVKTL